MKLVVREQRPLLGILIVLLVCVASAGTAWHLVQNEKSGQRSQQLALASENEKLERSNAVLLRDKQQLERRVAVLERSAQVEAQAYAQVDEHLESLQDEILTLKEEVAFYRGIVSDDSRSGVRIQRFLVESEGKQQDYRFRLVLTRGIRNDKVAQGSVTLSVDGDYGGRRKRFELKDLSPLKAGVLEFSFKHFQRLEGRLHLPESFVPRQVIVHVRASGKDSRPLRESFQWPAQKG